MCSVSAAGAGTRGGLAVGLGLAQFLGKDFYGRRLVRWAEAFGFNRRPPLDLPAPAPSVIAWARHPEARALRIAARLLVASAALSTGWQVLVASVTSPFYGPKIFFAEEAGGALDVVAGRGDDVHAGEDGTLVLILGSWLVALNWNDEEISIDVGSGGSMWLMLGTPCDVQLQGSLLVLPAYSGAILANELAR